MNTLDDLLRIREEYRTQGITAEELSEDLRGLKDSVDGGDTCWLNPADLALMVAALRSLADQVDAWRARIAD